MKFLAIDVGGTEIKYATITDTMEISNKGYVPTPLDTMEHFLDALEGIYTPVKDEVVGIAMSLPGFIDTKKGRNNGGGALLYNIKVNVAEKISERLGCTVHLENDAKAAAMAELWKGSLQDVDNGAVYIIGTGIGGGVIVDHKLVRGKKFTAGEFSFLSTNHNDCSSNTMLAHESSTPALLRYYSEFSGSDEKINGREFFNRYHNGDENAAKALDKLTQIIAVSVMDLGIILNAEKVAIGGGISAQDVLIEKIREKLDGLWMNAAFPEGCPLKPEVVRCTFANDANLIGAVASYIADLL